MITTERAVKRGEPPLGGLPLALIHEQAQALSLDAHQVVFRLEMARARARRLRGRRIPGMPERGPAREARR